MEAGELRRWPAAQLAACTSDYHPSRKLGEGGYGEVYAGELEGAAVAVKRMAADTLDGESGFLAELAATAAVCQPHVLPVLGVVRHPRAAAALALTFAPR